MFLKSLSLSLSIIFCFLFFCFGPFDPNNPFPGDNGNDTTEVNIPSQIKDSTILAYWDFNDSGNSVQEDLSDYNSHGVLDGCKWPAGIIGSALSFDGVDDYVSVSRSPQMNFDLKEFTISLFVKVSLPENQSDSFQYDIISKGEKCKSGFTVSITKNNVFGLINDHGCSNDDSTSITDGNWHHIVLLRRTGTCYLYFDTKNIDSFTCNDTVSTPNTLKFGVNSVKDEGYFSGIIDEVKILNKGWTETQIKAEYNRCF